MFFSPPTLHPNVIATDQQRDLARSRTEALLSRRPQEGGKREADGKPIVIPLTTVSTVGLFDSYIQLRCPLPRALRVVQPNLLVDSGSAMLIVPYGEQLTEANGYKLLGTGNEPWGAPAKIVQGPIQIPTLDGTYYEIEDCVFYACIGNNPSGQRTANFGLGCISPWSSNEACTPLPGVTLQSPLSYNASYPCVEVVYAPAKTMFADDGSLTLTDGSLMMLYPGQPEGFATMAITPNIGWMSLVPTSLAIGGQMTKWPGPPVWYLVALIDTGGTSAFVGDPYNLVWNEPNLPEAVTCPLWAQASIPPPNCTAARLDIGLAQSGGSPSYTCTIDTHLLPTSVQGLTLVMCQNAGRFAPAGNDSINTGGVTALCYRILIDYANTQVGFAPNSPYWTEVIELDDGKVEKAVDISPPSVPGVLIGYDYFMVGSGIRTTMKISWEDLPPGAVLHVQHGGSPGAEVLDWSGPKSATEASGTIEVTYGIFRQAGAAVPILIYAWRSGYVPVKIKVTATTN